MEKKDNVKIIKLTISQIKNLIEFFEISFIPRVQEDEYCDNMNYLVDMCDIYKKLKRSANKEGAE